MASPAYGNPGSDQIKLGPAPHVFALKFGQGKDVISKFPGGRVMFTAVDDRKLFLNDEDANEFEHALADLQIQPAEFIRVSRLTHGRGGGFAIRVERVEDPDPDPPAPSGPRHGSTPPSRLEAELAASIPLARAHGAAAFTAGRETERAAPARTARTTKAPDSSIQSDSTAAPAAPPATAKGTMTGIYAGALCASIDAYLLAADYARSKGITVDLQLDFNAEDIRQTATSMSIQYFQDGGTR